MELYCEKAGEMIKSEDVLLHCIFKGQNFAFHDDQILLIVFFKLLQTIGSIYVLIFLTILA